MSTHDHRVSQSIIDVIWREIGLLVMSFIAVHLEILLAAENTKPDLALYQSFLLNVPEGWPGLIHLSFQAPDGAPSSACTYTDAFGDDDGSVGRFVVVVSAGHIIPAGGTL